MAEKTAIAPEQLVLDSGRITINEQGEIFWTRNGKRAENPTGPDDYLQVRVMIDGYRYHCGAHRLVAWQFFGPIPAGMVVNHLNGKKQHNPPVNLEVCTPSENISHAHKTGLIDQRGQRNPAAKLTAEQVASLRAEYATGKFTQSELGDRYGIAFQTVSKLVRGDRRKVDSGPTADYTHRRNAAARVQEFPA